MYSLRCKKEFVNEQTMVEETERQETKQKRETERTTEKTATIHTKRQIQTLNVRGDFTHETKTRDRGSSTGNPGSQVLVTSSSNGACLRAANPRALITPPTLVSLVFFPKPNNTHTVPYIITFTRVVIVIIIIIILITPRHQTSLPRLSAPSWRHPRRRRPGRGQTGRTRRRRRTSP